MPSTVAKVLDRIEEDLKLKLKLLRENMSCIEYWEDCGDGGSWKPFTDEVTFHDDNWGLNELRINMR